MNVHCMYRMYLHQIYWTTNCKLYNELCTEAVNWKNAAATERRLNDCLFVLMEASIDDYYDVILMVC